MKLDEFKQKVSELSDQEAASQYAGEMLKVKKIGQWNRRGRREDRPCSYPNTLLMNLCRRELKRRGLSLPEVNLSEELQ